MHLVILSTVKTLKFCDSNFKINNYFIAYSCIYSVLLIINLWKFFWDNILISVFAFKFDNMFTFLVLPVWIV